MSISTGYVHLTLQSTGILKSQLVQVWNIACQNTKHKDVHLQVMNETKANICYKGTQEGHIVSRTSDDKDETRVKENGSSTERCTRRCSRNHYVKMFDDTGDRYQTANNRLLCCNCDSGRPNQIGACTPDYIHQNTDSFTENSLSEGNLYESVKHVSHQHPFTQTCTSCSVPIDGSGYLHPVSQIQSKHENELVHLNSNRNCCRSSSNKGKRNDFQNVTIDSGYAYMDHFTRSISLRQLKGWRIMNMNKYKFFRRGFYILSVLNLIFLLLNVVGLSYLVSAMETQKDNNVQDFNTCFECDVFHTLTNQDMKDLGIIKYTGGQCCVKALKDLLVVLVKGWPSQQGVERNYKLINTLLTRRRSAIQLSGFVTNAHIVWRSGGVIEGSLTYDEHGVHVNTGGTYYLYSKIGFKEGPCRTQRRIGYHVKLKGDKGSSTTLAVVQKLCLNGTNYEQDFAVQTVFKVPMGQKRRVVVEITADLKFLLKHHAHTFVVFEI